MINIDNFAIFDIYNNALSPSIPASPSTANYFYTMGNSYLLGASYSFYIISYNKGVPSINSMQTTVTLPMSSAPTSLIAVVNPTTPPTISLTWNPPSNNNIISADSYNIYQDGVLVHNVVQSSYNSDQLVAGNTYSFVIKPLHGLVEFNSPASISVLAYQQASITQNFSSLPKNNQVLLSWKNPENMGGLVPKEFNLSYIDDSGSQTVLIPYNSSNNYIQLISNLTNKTSYNFTIYFVTSQGRAYTLNGQPITITSTPTGSPIINQISYSNSNKTLLATVEGNGSSLLTNFIVISYDTNSIPTVNQFPTPSRNASTGLYNISQILPPSAVKASLVIANAYGITTANSW
jgi:hypothetical protein